MNAERVLHHQKRAQKIRYVRDAFFEFATKNGLPDRRSMAVHVYHLRRDRRSMPDVGAVAPVAKAAVDGLVGAGVLKDDDPSRLPSMVFHAPSVVGYSGMALLLTEPSTTRDLTLDGSFFQPKPKALIGAKQITNVTATTNIGVTRWRNNNNGRAC